MDVQELLNFNKQTVIVTGASQGIGAGIARRFAEAGANIVVHFRNGKAAADTLVKEIEESNGKAVSIQAELTTREGSQELVAQSIEVFGGLDVLVNNAGIYPMRLSWILALTTGRTCTALMSRLRCSAFRRPPNS